MHRERLPSRLTVTEFKEKFEHLKPGEKLRYHTGELAADRQHHNELDRLAESALILATDRGVEIDPINSVHILSAKLGTGEAILMQKRNGAGFEYLILKRKH